MKENVCTLFWVLRESINCNKADYLPISFLFVFLWVYSEFWLAITSLRFGRSQPVTPLQSLKITRRCNNHLSEKSLSYIINYCHKLEFKRENKPKVALMRTRNIFDNSGGRSNHYHRLMRKETHFYFLSTWEVFFPTYWNNFMYELSLSKFDQKCDNPRNIEELVFAIQKFLLSRLIKDNYIKDDN